MTEETPGKVIGRRLRALREKRLLSRPELATRAGVGVATIDHLERGISARPRRTTLEKLAVPLGVSVEELIGGAQRPLAPALGLSLMYAEEDRDARLRALEAASGEERAGYVAELDAAIERAERALIEDVAAANKARDADEKIALKGRCTVLHRYIGRLVKLRDEAMGEVAGFPAQAEIEERISA